MNGQVVQINTSPGGVPKTAVERAFVGEQGIEGDGHTYSGHGGPEKALCLYSLERILAFQAAGHPIFPGSLGENLTIVGLEWSELKPGDRFAIGDEVEIELVEPAAPCRKIESSFSDSDASRVDQQIHPGWARYYARVLTGGTLRPGALVESSAT
jgi:MOSC domain-containing protein YiiM